MRIWLKVLLIAGLAGISGDGLAPQLIAAPASEHEDAAVVHAIAHRFETAPGVPAYLLTITAKNGVVTLSGAVNDLLAREQAGQVAATISGVRTVRNRIEVRPTARSYASIGRSVDDALSAAPALTDSTIYPIIHDGFVTLTGKVDSWPERHLAGLLAEGVPGVRGIDNKLRVAYGVPRSDADIKADIESRIHWDPRLKTPELQVTVAGGKVGMRGFVESGLAREHAYQDGWVNGVKSVSVSGVEVVPSVRVAMDEAGEMSGAIASANGRLSDADLQTDIAKACHYDPLLKHDHVKVQVENGVIALRGTVPSLEARHAAQDIARDFAAAGTVKDLLQVQPVQTS